MLVEGESFVDKLVDSITNSLCIFRGSLDIISVLVVITILDIRKLRVDGLRTCKSTKLNDEYGIILHWSETPAGELRPSVPACVDKNDNVLQRRCTLDGFWEEFKPQKCLFYTLQQFTSCPSMMERIQSDDGEFCLMVKEPGKWQNSCLEYGETKSVLNLSKDKQKSLVNHLKTVKNMTELWLPAKRYQDFHPFQWILPGKKWGSILDSEHFKIKIKDNYKDKCLKLAFGGDKLQYQSEDCATKIANVCIYDSNSVVKLGCKGGLTTRFFNHHDKCFYIEKSFDPKKTLFKATDNPSRRFSQDLMDEFDVARDSRCLVDLGKSDNSQSFFTNTSFGNFTVMNRDGKWMMDRKYNCVIYEEKIELQVPDIYLKFDSNSGKMLLIIYSEEFLFRDDPDDSGVQCFTIADNELIKVAKIKRRLWSETIRNYDLKLFDARKTREISKSIYELKLYGNGPGVYWCEGHAIKSAQLIKSKVVIARRKIDGVVFAVKLQTQVQLTKDPIYEDDFLDTVTKQLMSHLKNNEDLNFYEKFIISLIKDVRVMKIEDFNELSLQLTAVYHFTVLKRFDPGSEEYEDFMVKYAEKFDDVKVVVSHEMMTYLEEIFKKFDVSKIKLISINSTEYCLPMTIKNPNPQIELLVWEQAQIGESLPPTELCVYQSGVPLTRKCEGDFIYGGTWETLTERKLQCVDQEKLTLHTKRLFSYNKVINSNETHGIIENMTSISSHYDQLIAADLFYISKTVQQITSVTNESQGLNLNSMDLDDKYNLTIIMNNIMNVNESFIQLSQLRLNTTNILLDSYDNLINSLSTNYSLYATINNNLISNSLNETDGTFTMQTEKIVVFICDPGRMNVSGMALVKSRKGEIESSLNDFSVVKLYSTQTIDDILNIYQDSLEIASYFPEELLNRIDEIKKLELNGTSQPLEPLKIVVKVYYNDAIFKESSPVSSYKSQSKIISVSLPGHDQNLPLLLPIMFKKSAESPQSNNDVCGYWEFQPNGTSSDSSEWVQEGCEFLGISSYDKNLALCGCSHLTHFAYLIMGTFTHDITPGDDVKITKAHERALNTITLLGSSLSVLGIIGIFITALNFRAWREKASTKVLLQLSLAIALQMVLFSFFSTEKHTYTIDTADEKRACIALGSGLHYSVLVTFSWMFITAFLQFKRYVIVLGNLKPERFFLKSFLLGWALPFVPIIIVLAVDPFLYIPETFGICYPQGWAFYFSVLLPVGIIVILNLVIFITVIYSILKGTLAKSGNMRKSEQSLTLSQLRVSIFLFFLLGLTWIFGLLAASQATILFSYLFCLTATIQGFVLFLYFIVMDPITRKLWRESFRSWSTRT